MDDYHNIVLNEGIQIEDLTPETLSKSFFAKPGSNNQTVYRPLAMFSFALNWYWSEDNPAGYHAFNLVLHILTAWLLSSTVYALLRKAATDEKKAWFVALLAASMWALNPIQVQAVTYVVQRMALMAAFFYIASMFFFVRGRMASGNWKKAFFFFMVGVGFAASMASKENSATLPFAVLLIEIVFFRDLGSNRYRKVVFFCFGIVAVFGLSIAAILFVGANPFKVLGGYDIRPFTLWERILTQPRVLIFYLTQIAYPIPSRLSIEHDIILSTSLLSPWTTLPAILSIVAAVTACFLSIRRLAFASFAILFFFLAHSVESTVLPLEIVFEHRNYLPSMFLFVPVASGLFAAMEHYRRKNVFMRNALVFFAISLLTCYGCGDVCQEPGLGIGENSVGGRDGQGPSLGPSSPQPRMGVFRAPGPIQAGCLVLQKVAGAEQRKALLQSLVLLQHRLHLV